MLVNQSLGSGEGSTRLPNFPVVFNGPVSGAPLTYVFWDGERLHASSDFYALLKSLEDERLLEVSLAGVALFLRLGFIPPPFTAYRNLYRLSSGDRLTVQSDHGLEIECEYLFAEQRSNGKSEPSTDTLVQLVAAALENQNATSESLFLQSAGKDSTLIAAGLMECGITGGEAITFVADNGTGESEWASRVARKMGWKHKVIRSNPDQEWRAVKEHFDVGGHLCGDLAFPAYASMIANAKLVEGDSVIDGLGSDIYMGCPVPRNQALLSYLCLGRFASGAWAAAEGLTGVYHLDVLLQTLFMDPAERVFPGVRMSGDRIRALFDKANVRGYIRRLLPNKALTPDTRGALIKLFEAGCTMQKGLVTVERGGGRVVFPYCDDALVNYYFNLPKEWRYSEEKGVNKVLVREAIGERFGFGEFVLAKGSFLYNRAAFIENKWADAEEEVRQAAVYLPEVLMWWDKFKGKAGSRSGAACLYLLLMLSMWMNRRAGVVVRGIAKESHADVMVSINGLRIATKPMN